MRERILLHNVELRVYVTAGISDAEYDAKLALVQAELNKFMVALPQAVPGVSLTLTEV